MVRNKTVVYFDNYNTDGYEEDARDNLRLVYGEEPSDEEVWNAVWSYLETDWAIMSSALDRSFDGANLIISGAVGRWDGRVTGGAIYPTWDKFIADFGKDCEYFEVKQVDGHLYVACSHHDGNNFCEVKVVTDAGDRYYDNWNYDTDPRLSKYHEAEIISRMFRNSKYARCPKIEW